MNSRSGSPGAPCARTHSSNSPHSGRWTLSYSARKLSQSLGSSAGYPENTGGRPGTFTSSGLQETMRTYGTPAVRSAGKSTTLSSTITSGRTRSMIPTSCCWQYRAPLVSSSQTGLIQVSSCSMVGLRNSGAVSRTKSFQNCPGSTAPSPAGAARSTRSSVNPRGASLPRHDASAAKTTRWPRRRSSSRIALLGEPGEVSRHVRQAPGARQPDAPGGGRRRRRGRTHATARKRPAAGRLGGMNWGPWSLAIAADRRQARCARFEPAVPRGPEPRRRRLPSWSTCTPATWGWTCAARWWRPPHRGGQSAGAGRRRPARSPDSRAVPGQAPQLQHRTGRLPDPGRAGQVRAAHPGHRQPQRRRPRHLGAIRPIAGGSRRRRGRAQHLLRRHPLRPARPRDRDALRHPGAHPPRPARHPAGGQAQPLLQRPWQPGPATGGCRRRRAGAVQPLLPARHRHRYPGGLLDAQPEPPRGAAPAAALAASSGVHSGLDAAKALLAGADVAMTTSALLLYGPEHLASMEAELRGWLERHGHDSVAAIRGSASRHAVRDADAYERANYIRTLTTIAPSRRRS